MARESSRSRIWRRQPFAVVAALTAVGLAGCGTQVIQAPSGPGPRPSPDGPTAVLQRSCASTPKSDLQARDVRFIQSSLLRQDAQLQRVADDLTGAVPGGNPPVDAGLAQANARDIADLVAKSALCSPLKQKLLAAAKELMAADDSLVEAAGAGDVAGPLQVARDRYDALRAVVQDLPAG